MCLSTLLTQRKLNLYEAKIIADSVNPTGQRCTTMAISYPRIVHAEVMTHRDRERNAGSSRAIPFLTMKRIVQDDPFIPLVWGAEQSGMQTGGAVGTSHGILAERLWSLHREFSIQIADAIHNIGATYEQLCYGEAPVVDFLNRLGFPTDLYTMDDSIMAPSRDDRIHKALPNRLIEAHQFITVVMTATSWKNFFALRCHEQAEIHFQKIAYMMRDALEESKPKRLQMGDWHLPYVTGYDYDDLYSEWHNGDCREGRFLDAVKHISVARCARVSYLTHEGTREVGKDINLYQRLRNPDGPPHASPMGHVCMAGGPKTRSGPFRGFIQHREEIPNECAD